MCGIAGFFAPPGRRADRRILECMVGTLRHRGPDALGYHVDGRLGLGVARPRVIDTATGDQPIANEDGSVHVVMNGEIYNFLELRRDLAAAGHRFSTRSDTEVLVHAWEEYGEHCVDHLSGMFAFALWDKRREQLLLARDRLGEKPLYYTQAGGWLVFGSELRAVLAHPVVSRELDLEGVSRYLAFDYVPDPHSIVRDVSKLPPAHLLTGSDGKLFVQDYWEIPFRPDAAVDEPGRCQEIARRFDEAVRLRLRSDVPLGCFLSGGIDSTAGAATAARERGGIRTFSVGYAEAAYDERPFARLVAERFATEHEELVVSASGALALLPQLGGLLHEPHDLRAALSPFPRRPPERDGCSDRRRRRRAVRRLRRDGGRLVAGTVRPTPTPAAPGPRGDGGAAGAGAGATPGVSPGAGLRPRRAQSGADRRPAAGAPHGHSLPGGARGACRLRPIRGHRRRSHRVHEHRSRLAPHSPLL